MKIPVLDKDNYFHWKVRMHLHLLSIDESYVNRIEKGPHVPMKVCTSMGADGEDMVGKMVPKPIHEYSQEDTEEVHKDRNSALKAQFIEFKSSISLKSLTKENSRI